MNIELITSLSTKKNINCLILAVNQKNKLILDPTCKLTTEQQVVIDQAIKNGNIDGKVSSYLLLNTAHSNILLVGVGDDKNISDKQFKNIINTAINATKSTQIKELTFVLSALQLTKRDSYWTTRFIIETTFNNIYQFEQFKKNKASPTKLTTINIFVSKSQLKQAEQAKKQAVAIANAINLVKDLGNLPANICNPKYLADQAKSLTKLSKKITVDIIDEKQMQKLGMNAYLAVSSGSHNPAYMPVIQYNNKPNSKPIVLVGKGITFDSGGISIKPSSDMDEMKYDMSGAATVYAVIHAIAELELPLNVVGIMAACENLPDGEAYRPGDIIKSMNGLSIEILSTDAEGRMVLCDALTYAERFKPAQVIDVATLTGACMVALGLHRSGLMANDNTLATELLNAGEQADDLVWQLPLGAEYDEQIKGRFADLANTGGRFGGAITAGAFLAKFAEKYKWAHLDIAGTAWKSGANKGATGRPVALLVQYLLNKVK